MPYIPPKDGIRGIGHSLTIKLPRKEYDEVQKMAAENNISVTRLVRHMIQYCLDALETTVAD